MSAEKTEQDIEKEFEELVDTRKYRRFAKWAIIIFFGGFLAWASLVPLEEGVPTVGKVVVDTKRKAVQHSTGGVIDTIYVKEGDFVEKDQLLMKLKDSKDRSEVIIEENKIESIKENINLQYISKRKTIRLVSGVDKQIILVEEELNGIRDLVSEGFAPKVQQIRLEKELNDLLIRKSELMGIKDQASQSIEELGFKLKAAQERLTIVSRRLEGKEIKASVSGQVVDLKVQAKGAVVRAAEKVMDIVPGDELLLIETQIMPNLIDRVAVNDIVDIRFTTFSLTPFLVIPGKVSTISTDVLIDQKTGTPYYLARVEVDKEGQEKLGNRKMRPGMEVGVIIKTGSRTLLTYLLHPLTRRIAVSLKEE